MKKVFAMVLFVLFTLPIFATDNISLDEVTRGVTAVIDTSYVAASQFFAVDESPIDSIVIRIPSGKILPDAIIVEEGDLSDYLQYFPQSTSTFQDSTYGSLDATVRTQLVKSDWKKGEAIVTGASAIVFQKDQSVFSLFTNALNGIFPKVGLVTDFYVDGTDFSQPLRIKGIFIVSGDENKELDIRTISLTINDREYEID
jgi:hypothetical protein